ncbi:MAG: sulfide/dihydroorotate dehydrogenase-like FAD/NAD-binding protein [Ignisphaera sp.]
MMNFEIINRKNLTEGIVEMDVHAPRVACAARPGQFVIVMACEECERIPLTLVDWSCRGGWIRLVFQEVGVSTYKLGMMDVGERLYHVAGPLGNPTHIDKFGTVAIVAGGVAIAAAYPIARAFKEAGNTVVSFIGARNSRLLIYRDHIAKISDEVHISTDDGSEGFKGFVTQLLEKRLADGFKPDLVWVVGPAPMMRSCSVVTKRFGVKTIASLNPIMVCGMGMCGACRVRIKNEIRFTCVDGPEFDAWDVDWDELLHRLSAYREEESYALKLFLESRGIKVSR